MKKLMLTVAVCCLFIAGSAIAGRMFGLVKGEGGKPVPGADVKIFGKDNLKTTSDSQGKFTIDSKDLVDGNMYSLIVTAEGYDNAQTFSVEMYDDPKEMQPIEVALSRPEAIPNDWTNTLFDPIAMGLVTNSTMFMTGRTNAAPFSMPPSFFSNRTTTVAAPVTNALPKK